MKSVRVLFIAPHRPNRSPAQRYRFEQYIPYLEQKGFVCKLAYLITAKEDKVFYAPGHLFTKAYLLIAYFLKRLLHVVQALQYDVVFIQREAYFMGGAFFETLFKWTGKKIIFDFDDAIWLPNVSEGNKKWLWLKSPQKTKSIIQLADRVIAGNNYLADYARSFNKAVEVIPSTIDRNIYVPAEHQANTVVIGWSGSPTTVPYFELLIPVFTKLKQRFGEAISFTLLGDGNYFNEALQIKGISWTSENEVPTINTFDIGIMPMPDDEWSKGKCAMKGIQYMALGIATVMTGVGMNKEVIQDGVNGFLANSSEEWEEKLSRLIQDADLRKRLGAAGKETIYERYTIQSRLSQFERLLRF